MAPTIDWATGLITIPKTDTTLVDAGPPEIRSLSMDDLHADLKALEASETGIVFPEAHRNESAITMSGEDFPRLVEFINGYTVDLENGPYVCRLLDGNNNMQEVLVVNDGAWQVQLAPSNTAALVNLSELTESVSELAAALIQATIAANNTQAT